MSGPVNTRTAGVVDPILSTHARGYKNSAFIHTALFPRVTVPSRSAKVIKFGKDDFRRSQTRRAPGADTVRVQFGYGADTVSLTQDALEGVVPFEIQQEAAGLPGIDMAKLHINRVLKRIELGHEIDASAIARNAANYDANHKLALTGTDRWSSPTSAPFSDIDEASDNVRRSIGVTPNTLILGPSAGKSLKRHPTIREQFKYTSDRSITLEMLAQAFELERVIMGKAVFLPEGSDDTAMATDIWGDDAILAYIPPEEDAEMGEPSYGYTYELSGYPMVEQPYPDRRAKSWIYPTTSERKVYLTGPESGFLFQNAGAPAA
ncbi:MAG: hypothetical protein BGP11_08405 [Rhodobacterales bacterium 65-51]|uniref:major capsid protein n=1 Tax=uncultured Gemmobacter sp. TaxID=1095917 RepID=UPI00096682C6|nr:major capsid protein [uncultured Gemmobacter sp.]OJY36356.1 MAG: hypothetical protein BGP11_08405 [Rhodobacterales bacterium 65-51]